VIGGSAYGFSPEYEPALHELARSEGIHDRMTFAGHRPDAARYLPAVDVLVNASNPEGYGVVLLEAMAHGVPTVAFAVGGPLDIVVDGETGLLVQPDDPEALVDTLAMLVADPALRHRLGAAGRRRAGAFTPHAAATRVQRILEDAAQ
jgi:glycosyltransferase involved in cell wall biosynthesis